jgi:hypothetical protein
MCCVCEVGDIEKRIESEEEEKKLEKDGLVRA